jgi:integrase
VAWIESHAGRDGRTWWYVRWRDPDSGARRTFDVGAVHRDVAEQERVRIEHDVLKIQPRRSQTEPSKALDGFLTSRRAASRAEATIRYYRTALEPFFEDQARQHRPLRRWTRGDVEAWTAAHRETWSPRAAQIFVTCCRTFIAWRQDAGLDVPDFVGRFRAARGPKGQRPALPPESVRALLTTARKAFAVTRPWVEPVVALAAYGLLSLGDIRTLTWDQVDLDARLIRRARRKTGEPLETPIAGPLLDVLDRNRATHGQVVRGLPESDSGLSKAVRELYDAAGVKRTKGDGIHRLRDAGATLLAAEGVDQATIGRLLGHAPGSAVTARYIRPDVGARHRAIDGLASQLSMG